MKFVDSQELFGLDDENDRYLADVRGAYRTLWTHGIPADVVTPNMDWSGYRLMLLPNLALMTEEARSRIEKTLADQPETRIVAEGSFGMYQMNGASSYGPPEGFADIVHRLCARVPGDRPESARETIGLLSAFTSNDRSSFEKNIREFTEARDTLRAAHTNTP